MKKILSLMFAGLLLLFTVTGCNLTDSSGLTKVTLSEVAHSIFYAPMYVAIEEGYFKDEGIDLDDCELISRKFSDILENNDPISQAYRLEVSSPGIERPLKRTKDFQRFQGEKVQVKTFSEVEGKKQFIGILQETTEETVTLDVDGTSIAIPRKQIGKANLVWEF